MSLPINLSQVSRTPVWTSVPQSPPLDLSLDYDLTSVKGKHIIITGGASGIGAAFARTWASHGASIVIGDVNTTRGEELVASIRQETGNAGVYFVRCDVRSWDDQVELFKQAIRTSPHGGIDVVVPNAGIAPPEPLLAPSLVDGPEPKKPDLKCVEINLTGVLYTTYLALFYLPKNPGSSPADPRDAAPRARDRHLLLVGSIASTVPIAGQAQYGASKHGVMGLFRSLRSSAHVSGVRVNIICPYFVNTDIVPLAGKLLLAGAGWAEVDGVVEAASRLVSDTSICGRGLYVGPKVKVRQESNGDWWLTGLAGPTGSRVRPAPGSHSLKDADGAFETSLWEVFADDLEDSELFTVNMIRVINAVAAVGGWTGWAKGVVGAFLTPVRLLLGR